MRQLIMRLAIGLFVICLEACSNGAVKSVAESGGKIFRATGFAHFAEQADMPVRQRWLMAQQAAKLDAARDLAEQLYRENLDVEKTVGSQVMRDELYRQYLDTFLREARAVDYRTVKEALKATLELKVTPRFYTCMAGNLNMISLCLKEDNKLAMTRLGLKKAGMTSVSLKCANTDCSDQYIAQGFSKPVGIVDDVLLDNGLPNSEWTISTSTSLFSRTFLLSEILHGF